MEFPWMHNTKGEPSTSLTFATVGFVVVMAWMVAHIFAGPLGLTIAAFDAGEAMIVLTPLLGLYFGRRYTDTTNPPPVEEEPVSTPRKRSRR